MIFLGNEEDLARLQVMDKNFIESILMDAFNAGYTACNKAVTDMYNAAEAAVEQGLVNEVPAGQNFIIELIQKANKMKE